MSSEISVNVFKSLVEKTQEYSLLKKENSNNKKNATVDEFYQQTIYIRPPDPGILFESISGFEKLGFE